MNPISKHPQRRWKAFYEAQVAPLRHRKRIKKIGDQSRLVGGSIPQHIPSDGFVLFCGFKDCENSLESFFKHYEELGCTWFFLIDDGSTDRSREIIAQHANVALFESDVSYVKNQNLFRQYFISSYASGVWSLWVDRDEFLEYPHAGEIPFSGFLKYLDAQGYEGATACMVDRFSKLPIGKSGYLPGEALSKAYPYYDLSNIVKFPLLRREMGWRGSSGSTKICDYYGGVRGPQFDFWPRLLKVPLLKYKAKHAVRVHMTSNVNLADTTLLLNHYRYMDDFVESIKATSVGYSRGGYGFRFSG